MPEPFADVDARVDEAATDSRDANEARRRLHDVAVALRHHLDDVAHLLDDLDDLDPELPAAPPTDVPTWRRLTLVATRDDLRAGWRRDLADLAAAPVTPDDNVLIGYTIRDAVATATRHLADPDDARHVCDRLADLDHLRAHMLSGDATAAATVADELATNPATPTDVLDRLAGVAEPAPFALADLERADLAATVAAHPNASEEAQVVGHLARRR